MSKFSEWLRHWQNYAALRLGLREEQAASREWAIAYRFSLCFALLLSAFGGAAGLLRLSPSQQLLFDQVDFLFISAAIGIYLLLRMTSLVYERPLRRSANVFAFVGKRPLLLLLFAVLLHAETAVSIGSALGLDARFSPLPLRALVALSLVLCALPFWFWVLHPLSIWRRAREVREMPSPVKTIRVQRRKEKDEGKTSKDEKESSGRAKLQN